MDEIRSQHNDMLTTTLIRTLKVTRVGDDGGVLLDLIEGGHGFGEGFGRKAEGKWLGEAGRKGKLGNLSWSCASYVTRTVTARTDIMGKSLCNVPKHEQGTLLCLP